MTLDLPAWAEACIHEWRERLGLTHWCLHIKIALCVNDDAETKGMCEQQPDYNSATLTFRADIDDTKEWRETIIHELLHVQHSRIDHFVECAILPQLDEKAQALAREAYHQYVESYTTFLTDAFMDMRPTQEQEPT